MTSMIVGWLFIIFITFATYKMFQYSKNKAIAARPAKPVIEPKKPVVIEEPKEKPIEEVIASIKRAKKHDHQIKVQDWDKQFSSYLPDEEKPDYIEVSPNDEVIDDETFATMAGPLFMHAKRKTANGEIYGYFKDFGSGKAHIIHYNYKKEVDW